MYGIVYEAASLKQKTHSRALCTRLPHMMTSIVSGYLSDTRAAEIVEAW